MAPVVKAADEKSLPYRFIFTGQHRDTVAEISANFKIRPPDYTIYEGPDIVSIPSMVVWAVKVLWRTYRDRRRIFVYGDKGIALVHGDTFSTLLGSLMAKIGRQKVGHVESGLRSFNLFNPFPEEVIRLLVFRLADIYFCPGSWAATNLSQHKGRVVNTERNTLHDALSHALVAVDDINVEIPDYPFSVVSLHRYENIFRRSALSRILDIVEHVAKQHRLIFVLHNATEKKLRQFGLYDRVESNRNIRLENRYDYFDFIKLLNHSEFVISDGGSNQEECAYLGKPILLLRKATERKEGIGYNCVVSNYNREAVDDFLRDYKSMKVEVFPPALKPSDIILEHVRGVA